MSRIGLFCGLDLAAQNWLYLHDWCDQQRNAYNALEKSGMLQEGPIDFSCTRLVWPSIRKMSEREKILASKGVKELRNMLLELKVCFAVICRESCRWLLLSLFLDFC